MKQSKSRIPERSEAVVCMHASKRLPEMVQVFFLVVTHVSADPAAVFPVFTICNTRLAFFTPHAFSF